MKKTCTFLYYRDPLFLTMMASYFLNRWVIKPVTLGHISFFHSYFNDLICIPFWLPSLLYVYRLIGVRRSDCPPTLFELTAHVAVWSFFFEVVGPRLPAFFPKTFGDPWDAASYTLGALIAGLIWWSPLYARFTSKLTRTRASARI